MSHVNTVLANYHKPKGSLLFRPSRQNGTDCSLGSSLLQRCCFQRLQSPTCNALYRNQHKLRGFKLKRYMLEPRFASPCKRCGWLQTSLRTLDHFFVLHTRFQASLYLEFTCTCCLFLLGEPEWHFKDPFTHQI